MTVAEPATTLTDYLMAAVGLLLGGRLVTEGRGAQTAWGGALLLTGVASFIGGTSHGFAPYFSAMLSAGLWLATWGMVGLASLLILSAAAWVAVPAALRAAAVAVLVAR